jgi:arylsulfatase A-like enzyme
VRILYIDVDSLRPDHLGCYGYHRDTSPAIDAVARDAVRFESCYVSDTPCLPSRTALWSGRTGFHTGVVNHGGTAAQPFVQGAGRGFQDTFSLTGWMQAFRNLGMRTATVSSFAGRHSAWHWHAGYQDMLNPGLAGMETAGQVNPIALQWIRQHAREEDWFLHINYWDPHTPYRTPMSYGEPFAGDPPPAWITEEYLERCWRGFGPHSAQEPTGNGFWPKDEGYPRVPIQIDSMESMKRWLDGYDTGIRYMDDHIAQILNALADVGVLDETAVIIGADHGEMQGELNVWGDHQAADHTTSRVPLIVRWPGIPGGRVDAALHYHFDWAATTIELAGGSVPENWDGRSFAGPFREGRDEGREYLVLSMGAWSCMRSVRWGDLLCARVYHDGYKDMPEVMLFDLAADPHELRNLAGEQAQTVDRAMAMLSEWHSRQMLTSDYNVDPLMTVLREGGPWQVRGELPRYAERLRATGRAAAADYLLAEHQEDLTWQ